jgi:hypothetical protein
MTESLDDVRGSSENIPASKPILADEVCGVDLVVEMCDRSCSNGNWRGWRERWQFVGGRKAGKVNEEKGDGLGAKLDEIRAHVLDSNPSPILDPPITACEKVRSFCPRAEPVRQSSAGVSSDAGMLSPLRAFW